MRKEQEVVNKYITDDGEIFYNEEEAIEHENFLIILEKVYSDVIRVGEYCIYTINTQEELDALKNDDCDSNNSFDLPNEISFPLLLCETCDNGGYYFHYETLDDVIQSHIELLDKLIAVQKKR